MLFTCEHGGNEIPPDYAHLFASAGALAALASHRGHDIGAADVARRMAEALGAPLIVATTSRLLIDLNRSIGHRGLFSEFTRALPPAARRGLVDRVYRPHRIAVETAVADAIERQGRCVHVAVHSFTPTLEGSSRNAEVGLLYDPSRRLETQLCRRWQAALTAGAARHRVRRNYPYRGVADGLTTALRRRFTDARYAGIELELNQAVLASASGRRRTADLAATALAAALREMRGP